MDVVLKLVPLLAQCDGTALGVETVTVEPERALAGQHLGREGLVDLDDVDSSRQTPLRSSIFPMAGTGPSPERAGCHARDR